MIFNKSEYNQSWNVKVLNELGIFNRGKSKHRPRNDKALFEDGKYPLIQTGEIKSANLYITKHNNSYNDFGLKQSKLWDKNTLCITIAANIAETALLDYPMCFPDSVVGFNAYSNESSELFMHYVFTYIKTAIQNSASGSIQDNINLEYLTGLKFKIPNKEYQDKIASILSSLDKKIELNNQINQKLESMAKTLYDYWFVQFDFPDAEGKPYKSSGGKMVYSEELKREIPLGWEVDNLSNLIKIDRGISYKSSDIGDSGTPMINLNSFYLNGSYKHKGLKYFSSKYKENKVVKPNDLLIATTDVTRNADIIGKAILIPDMFKSDILMSCDIARVTTNKKLDKYFLEMLFNSDYYHSYIKGFASGTLVLHLNMNGIGWFKIFIPPSHILENFSKLKINIEKKKNIILIENQKLTQLRDWLLPMLMNGQVGVE